MIIITKKLRPRRLAASLAIAFVGFGLLGAAVSLAQDILTAQTAALLTANPTDIKTNEDRVAYLEDCGWIVAAEASSKETLQLPDSFSEDYADYLSLQESQGFDLTQYAGKSITRYTYQVRNYPGLQENIWACLLLYKDRIIGGEVWCSQGDGFVQGLAYPAQT